MLFGIKHGQHFVVMMNEMHTIVSVVLHDHCNQYVIAPYVNVTKPIINCNNSAFKKRIQSASVVKTRNKNAKAPKKSSKF